VRRRAKRERERERVERGREDRHRRWPIRAEEPPPRPVRRRTGEREGGRDGEREEETEWRRYFTAVPSMVWFGWGSAEDRKSLEKGTVGLRWSKL
jgi:hypothetical protein